MQDTAADQKPSAAHAVRMALPADGIPWGELRDELLAIRGGDVPYRRSQYYYFWRKPGANVGLAAQQAAALWAGECYVGRAQQASTARIASELTGMASTMLGVPGGGTLTLTNGGSESNFLAMLAARERARALEPGKRLRRLNIVVPESAHFSFGKAALYLDLDLVRVPLDDRGCADARAMAAAIDDATVAVVGSAPCFPYGAFDPIEAIAAIARERDLWCHVDGCVGGFVSPYLRRAGLEIPPFGFEVPGVCSLSADLHKYAYAFPTVSTLSVARASDARYHNFATDSLLGEFQSNVFSGTRAAGTLVAAWTILRLLGDHGYLDAAVRMREHIRILRDGIESIPGLIVTVEPRSPIFLFTSREMDIPEVAAGMVAAGYPTAVYPLDHPQIHLLLDPLESRAHAQEWLECLRQVCARVRRGETFGTRARSTYG